MSTTPYTMYQAFCDDCDRIEMMPDESILTQKTDHIKKNKRLTRIERFVCPCCGAMKTKKYIENFESND